MIILISSKIDETDIQAALGKPEYSYFFLMKDFMPALQRVGTVMLVKSVAEIESLHARYNAEGQAVVFLSFSPPHQVPVGLACPTVSVFAWEFDSLPSVAWDNDSRNDWRYVFSHTQGAITTSKETALLVDNVMHGEFPVIPLPAPIWDRYASVGEPEGWPIELGERQFPFAGIVIDSPILGLSADGLVRRPESAVESSAESVPLDESLPAHELSYYKALRLSASLLKGWLRELCFLPRYSVTVDAPLPDPPLISVSGVVYTTVLNPADGRKNWVDLITAFCWAFKNTDDATLIVKMTHHDLEHYRIVLMTLLSRLAPFRCRVLVLHGFLEDEQYKALIRASSYYVNSSSCEGLCLPLMEFLASGKPAIAPDHTAMADYLNDQLAFVLKYSLEPTCWPHDPTGMLYTHRHRLNWQSLMEAFRSSYQLAHDNPSQYQDMSRHACRQMHDFASVEQVSKPLEAFLHKVLASAAGSSGSLKP